MSIFSNHKLSLIDCNCYYSIPTIFITIIAKMHALMQLPASWSPNTDNCSCIQEKSILFISPYAVLSRQRLCQQLFPKTDSGYRNLQTSTLPKASGATSGSSADEQLACPMSSRCHRSVSASWETSNASWGQSHVASKDPSECREDGSSTLAKSNIPEWQLSAADTK